MWVAAIRSGIEWQFDPGPDDVISEDDVLLVRGPEEGVVLLRELAGAPGVPGPAEEEGPPLSELDRAVDLLVELKDPGGGRRARVLLDPVQQPRARGGGIGARGPERHPAGRARVVGAARGPEARNPDELRGLLRLANASESMSDAARDMTWYVEQGEPLHPVVQLALEETEETSF